MSISYYKLMMTIASFNFPQTSLEAILILQIFQFKCKYVERVKMPICFKKGNLNPAFPYISLQLFSAKHIDSLAT